MHLGKTIAVIVPAFDEERLIGRTLGGIPGWVDVIVAVDDASRDRTAQIVQSSGDPRVTFVRHEQNRGVGAAIATGYRRANELGAEVLVVMAGDDQMDPSDLAALVEPVAAGRAEYAKGNRFRHADRHRMPRARRVAGKILARVTRCATGLDIDDSQCGYTALSARAASRLPLEELWPRYGYPNDLLGMLAAEGLNVEEVPVRPIYADERSGVRPWHAFVVCAVIARRWLRAERARRAQPIPDSGALRNIHI